MCLYIQSPYALKSLRRKLQRNLRIEQAPEEKHRRYGRVNSIQTLLYIIECSSTWLRIFIRLSDTYEKLKSSLYQKCEF